ncbi:MAG TPA: ABC transporter permease, partial [bacterium]|nr:ABC transporter permease [bacterium]
SSKLIWPLLALIVLLALNGFFTPGFFHIEIKSGRFYGHIIDIMNQAAPVMLLSLGMTLVIATGGVDLSVGAVMAISGAVMALLTGKSGVFMPAGLLLTLILCVIAGTWNGLLVSAFDIQPIVATLILMVAGRGIAQLLTQGQILTFHDSSFAFIGSGSFAGLPFSVTVVLVWLAVTAVLSRATAIGMFVESIGDNTKASRYAGISVNTVKLFVYAFSGLCAGMAGLLVASGVNAADSNNAGLYYELDAILAVIVGGTAMSGGRFSLIGSMIGALIIQTLTTSIRAQNVPVEFALVVKAIVALAVFLLQSDAFNKMFAGRKAGV